MSNANSQIKLLHTNSQEESIRSASNCSCSQCNLDDCFKIRNISSTSNCSCLACKHAKACSVSNKPLSNETKNTRFDTKSNIKKDKETKIKSEVNEIQKEIFPDMIDNEALQINDRKCTKYRSKDVTLKKEKIDWNADKKSYEKTSTRQFIHSVAITYSPKERENSTVKLSAQIMDMPYDKVKDTLTNENNNKSNEFNEDYKNTILPDLKETERKDEELILPNLTDHFPDLKETERKDEELILPNLTDHIKSNILTRLKEIYKACSCKVCECVAGRSLTFDNDYCACKPFNGEQCSNFTSKLMEDNIKPPHSGCPCVKCDRKDCRGVVKNTGDENCDCKPCDCIKCGENVQKPCSCVPCECTECVALRLSLPRSITVAPVQGNFQQNLCQCEPCECANCTQNYASMSSSSRREISTDVSFGNCYCNNCLNDSCQTNSDICRCDMQNKIIKRPLDGNGTDYDIHRTIVSHGIKRSKIRNKDTIAMFALSDNSNGVSNRIANSVNCHCLECECLVCNEKQTYSDANQAIHSEIFDKYSELCTDLSSICTCSPCICHICQRRHIQCNELGIQCYEKYCGCRKCSCLICKGLIQYTKSEVKNTKITNHLFQRMQGNTAYSKKGRILTPATFDASPIPYSSELQNQINNEYSGINDNILRNKSRYKKVTIYHTRSKHNDVANESTIYNKIIDFKNSEFLNDIVSLEDKCMNRNLGNMSGDKLINLKRNVILSKNVDSIMSLKEIFHSSKRTPIRDMELLNKCIYLTKSHSKIMSETYTNTYIKDTFSETVYSRTNIKNSGYNYENQRYLIRENNNQKQTLDKDSLKCTILPNENLRKEMNIQELVGDNAFNKALDSKENFEDVYDFQGLSGTKNGKCEIAINTKIKEKAIRRVVAKYIKPKRTEPNFYKRSVKLKSMHYNKMYQRLIRRTNDKTIFLEENFINDRINIAKTDVNKDVLTIIDNLIDSLETEIRKIEELAPIAKNVSSISVNNPLHNNIINTDEVQHIEQDDVNNRSWPILQNNLCLNCTDVNEKTICTIPSADLDIKSIKSITNPRMTGTKRGKEALTQLLIEVQNLLNSPLLQSARSSKQSVELKQNTHSMAKDPKFKSIYSDAVSQTLKNRIPIDKETNCNILQSMDSLYKNMKQIVDFVLSRAAYKSEIMTTKYNLTHDSNHEIPKVNSKSSCDGLKAAFVDLKTISDHTLIVKWRLPLQVEEVQGYELQVDGRPVQKIFSPTRCMAVLTCLPNTEKLLLTIRTLTANLPSDHNPASTIVYRPHVKSF